MSILEVATLSNPHRTNPEKGNLMIGKPVKPLPKYVPLGRIAELKLSEHPHADRIGMRYGRSWDSECEVKIFSCREVLARCIRMQSSRESRCTDWKAVVQLRDSEGY